MAEQFDGLLQWRCIGPFRGGRVVTVAGDPHDNNVFYFGACAGGVWKTDDAGQFWYNVSDGFFKTSSVGALAVSESDPNVVWAGMGEATIRIDVSHGDGVYRSTDAGKTWKHMGLSDTRHIAKVRIHPTNPDIVWVAAFGHAFGPNEERGIFKTTDGGETWRKVLYRDENSGAIDLTVDATNPRILYATTWQGQRKFWDISSGGPGSAVYRSKDGGETWEDISHKPGLPKGTLGKMGITASPVQAGRVWCLIQHAEAPGLYRSDDGGDTWKHVSDNEWLVSRAWYYMHIHADTQDANTVYINNLSFWKSTDGGHTFNPIDTPHGDNHDLWISPVYNRRMIQGNDGGANVSFNAGGTWTSVYNQPTSQFYHIGVDNRTPYRVYGTQQDNSSLAVPSRTPSSSIPWSAVVIAGTGESGYITVDPKDDNIVYLGAIGSSSGGGNCLQRYDERTKQIRLVTTWPEATTGEGAISHKYRFAWTYPIVFSPHDPNVLYAAGNVVFKTTNEGQSWTPISPDLTRNDPSKLQITGGPIDRDSVGAEVYCTVFSFTESPHRRGELWSGSDDGLIHVSRDNGASWQNVTPSDLPEWAMVTSIEVSPHDANTITFSAARHKMDDYAPYIYRSTDSGKSWVRVVKGIAGDHFVRIVREDTVRKGLLFAGTETNLYVSFNQGDSWELFQLNLPVTPIYDLIIKNDDLVCGTHGRAIWILDDLTPLRQYNPAVNAQPAHLFAPRPTERILAALFESEDDAGKPGKNYMAGLGDVCAHTVTVSPEGYIERHYLDSGTNPPRGAIITYWLKETAAEPIRLAFYDSKGGLVNEFFSRPEGTKVEKSDDTHDLRRTTANAGWNRFIWDMRVKALPKIVGKDPIAGSLIYGPKVTPGKYTVELTVGGQKFTQSLTIVADAFSDASQEDLEAQFNMLMQIYNRTGDAVKALNQMRDTRAQLDGLNKRLAATHPELAAQASALRAKVLELEKQITVPDVKPGWPGQMNHGTKLFAKLGAIADAVSVGNYRPTDQAVASFSNMSEDLDEVLSGMRGLASGEIADLAKKVAAAGVGNIIL
ncbi:MAG: WD40/YVTN/BNR-like repeat-containing protein [Chloroflexota bacterium]